MNGSGKIQWLTFSLAVLLPILAVQSQIEQLAFLRADENSATMRRADQLIGSEVRNYQGDKTGTVDDIVLDRNSDRISYLVLTTGGFMGVGEKHIAVPLQAVRTDISGKTLMVNLSKAALQDVPKLTGNWPSGTEQELREANNFFAQISTDFKDWLQKEPAAGEKMVSQSQIQSKQPLTADQQRWIRRTSNLVGVDVRNMQNRTVGKLTDLVFDLGTGKVAFGLIEIQNIEGLENQMAACPWGAVNVRPQEKIAQIDVSESTLRSVAFRPENRPDLSNRLYANNIYRQFSQKPYWTEYGFEGDEGPGHKQDTEQMRVPGKYMTY